MHQKPLLNALRTTKICLCVVLLLPQAWGDTVEIPTDVSLNLPKFSVLEKAESFQIKIDTPEFTVTYPPILPNSEKITTSNGIVLVRDVDYHVDFYAGKITLEKSKMLQFLSTEGIDTQESLPSITKDVTITYRALPFAIERVYQRNLFGSDDALRDDKSLPPETSPGVVGQGLGTQSVPTSQLEVSGSQTFGISMGSGRAGSQTQELRFNAEGKVSENISVLLMLSNQDLPIQPEGTTENIQDIDEKLVRITHPNVSGTLGDFEGSLGSSEFIFFPRALEGVQVDGEFSWGRFHLIPSALPKGQSTSLVIPGEEGRSEYRLSVEGQYVIVKAGSEIVWLNGERMRRGENNDYVIREYGDAIIEFNSKHLITRNDIIRVDFEYIPEDRAYQQNLYGINSIFTLPGNRFSFGASYAVETDLNQPEQALIILSDEDVDALRHNILDPGGDGSLLTAPQKHTVWGLESRLNLTEKMWMEGQFAYSALDKNTYSTADRKEVSQAWKLNGYASWEKLTANLDIRAMDAGFVPVGASSSNRSRARYETQYATEGFDDAFLFSTASPSQAQDETTLNFALRGMPTNWLEMDAGLGRSEERDRYQALGSSPTGGNPEGITRRNNFNWGINFNQRVSRSGARLDRTFGRTENRQMRALQEGRSVTGNSLSPYDSVDERKNATAKTGLLKFLPNLRWDDYRSNVTMQSADAEEVFRKSRQEGNLTYPLGPFEVSGTLGRLESNDAQNAIRNRMRNRSTARVNLVGFKWASLHNSYELESAFAKEPLLAVDGEALGISDWQRDTTARTWKMGIFSQQGKWVNLTTNLARRRLKAHTELGTDTTTQLADIALQLTPLSRAIDAEITYELDKKLTTQRREIYTDIHPHTGRRLQPGEGYFVKLDDLHYVEDLEEGTHIKIYQNVGDKPTTAIDAAFRLRFQPRQFFARRERTRGVGGARLQSAPTGFPVGEPSQSQLPSSSVGEPSRSRFASVYERGRLEWFLNALRGQTRLWLTEEQEAEDAVSLYLLRNLQGSQTLFGRINQHHRLEFSPSPRFSFEFNLRLGRTLNRRINTQERNRQHRTWDVALSVNPTERLSVGINWEQRRETEKYSQLHEVARLETVPTGTSSSPDSPEPEPPTPISDLRQFEQNTELNLRYQLSRSVRWSGIGGYKRTTDQEHLDEEPEAKTRTFSFENRVTYSLIGKGRVDFNYKLGYGASEGGVPIAQYYFYEGISHEVRVIADYRLRKFTDLLFRINYRLLSTRQRKPEHRLEMSVSAEL